VSISPDGRTLALSGVIDKEPSSRDKAPVYQGEVKLWEMQTGKLLHTLPGHIGWVGAVAFSPLGSTLVTGNSDGTMELWDAATGKLVRTLKGEEGVPEALAFSPGGTILYSLKGWGRMEVWHLPSGQLLRTVPL
jgi:WD40 repeat protein